MLKIEKFVTPSPDQWEITVEGMRNAMNSWDRMDSAFTSFEEPVIFELGPNDQDLMMRLNDGGSPHAKYRRMLPVHITMTAPLYWWKEFETYRVGVASNPSDIEFNSCSTMHKIHAKEFVRDDFSYEHLHWASVQTLDETIFRLNFWRDIYVNGGYVDHFEDGEDRDFEPRDKFAWQQMIQLLPSSYNQKRTVYLNYQVLHEMYKWRKNHKLDEWRTFCRWIAELPYSELITEYSEDEE